MKRQPSASPPQTAPPTEAPLSDLISQRSSAQESGEQVLAFMRAITDNLGEGTYALDLEGRVTFMNPAAERMLGWTEAELRGKDMHAAIHFQHADGTPFPRDACPLLQVIRSGEAQRVEDDTFTRRDGTMFPVAYVSSPIMMNGRLAGAVLAFHDISEHKALDEALRRSEREAASRASQLMAIFDSMADAVLVYGLDGQIVQTNGADAELFAAQEPVDSAVRTMEQRDRQFVFLDEAGQPLPLDRWPTTRALRGETLRGDSAMDLVVTRAADGRRVVVNASGAPIRDANGNIVGGVLIGRDVTQRRRLERQSHEALRALMAMAGALVSNDDTVAESAVVSAQAQMVVMRLAELARAVIGCERVGVHLYNLETQIAHTLAVAGLTKEQAQFTPHSARLNNPREVVKRLQAGEVIEVDLTQPPYNRWANPLGSRSVLLAPVSVGGPILGDISLDFGPVEHHPTPDEYAMASAVAQLAAQVIERERLARDREAARANVLALAEITRQMDEFLGIAAHELRSPVTNGMLSVTLAIDTLRSLIAQAGAAGTAIPDVELADALQPIEEMLERTGEHMERLSRLVVDLLDVSRIRAGKLELRVAPCNLADLVREVVAEQRRMAPGRVIRLQLPSAPKQPAVVLADADRIRQVVTNYLTNAVKYSDANQRITVRLHMDDEWARISVQDGGPGIPAAERRRIWERFYRIAGTQAPSSGGAVSLGLGLYVSRMIIEQHQGRVGVHSARGKGAIFWFALQLMTNDR